MKLDKETTFAVPLEQKPEHESVALKSFRF